LTRTYVRVRAQSRLYRSAAARGCGVVRQLRRDASPPPAPDRRRQSSDDPEVRAALGHLRRPLRRRGGPACGPPALSNPARSHPRRKLDLQPRPPQGAAVCGRAQAAALRAVWPRRGVARAPDVADPRSHQRGGDGPPDRQPPDRVPELRRHARHPLRSQQAAPPLLRGLRSGVSGRCPRSAALLGTVAGVGRQPASRRRRRPERSSGRRTSN